MSYFFVHYFKNSHCIIRFDVLVLNLGLNFTFTRFFFMSFFLNYFISGKYTHTYIYYLCISFEPVKTK